MRYSFVIGSEIYDSFLQKSHISALFRQPRLRLPFSIKLKVNIEVPIHDTQSSEDSLFQATSM